MDAVRFVSWALKEPVDRSTTGRPPGSKTATIARISGKALSSMSMIVTETELEVCASACAGRLNASKRRSGWSLSERSLMVRIPSSSGNRNQ
jgi:hypothetical protein